MTDEMGGSCSKLHSAFSPVFSPFLFLSNGEGGEVEWLRVGRHACRLAGTYIHSTVGMQGRVGTYYVVGWVRLPEGVISTHPVHRST